jgi:hypothetical protein
MPAPETRGIARIGRLESRPLDHREILRRGSCCVMDWSSIIDRFGDVGAALGRIGPIACIVFVVAGLSRATRRPGLEGSCR